MSQNLEQRQGPANDNDWYDDADLLPERPPSEPAAEAALEEVQVAAQWAADDKSADYRHLGQALDSQAFDFTAQHLKSLCEANRFNVDGGQDEVLFGLRGCKLAPGTTNDFANSVRLMEDKPDHFDFHCVLGVWKRSTSQLCVFRASTVPNRRHMRRQLNSSNGQLCNMLPTGRYSYTVGRHRAVRGAFIQQPKVVVQRTKEDLTYETTDFYERHDPADNIHPAFSDSDAKFSSAGCMTVPGNWTSNGGHQGSWATFRQRAGLSADNESHMGDRFIYVLLTGREARLVATGTSAATLARLRFGSVGAEVTQLQQALQNGGFDPNGIDTTMGPGTVMALIRRQQAQAGNAADGICPPPFA